MEETVERHVVEGSYGDIPIGVYLARGDAIAYIGDIDEDADMNNPYLRKVDAETILEEERAAKEKEKERQRLGLSVQSVVDSLFVGEE
mmetsp:Transcript_15578/g.39486  ORF Transcript_15578/g.39486 Transcript_15578/m.39486 type:complete len:88 (+) Transcript_15578:341-604(+)|eukprot:CAMPEP_0113884954 /NCGR_PEP_ID=MMETSP0780_2-20120614/10595_1 /TAXON_ID=652834 /ORGANISM="Palpitomonas bilix" /LENGTH=87 /DNA_ID=CAMNT_0000872733 /DNA_START=227 /DNA_END=490 /DNA_ORIENTATION=- /assembly_acc=CAM_ASM_000599